MVNLVLTYVMLFFLAGVLGMIAGWMMRQFIQTRQERALEEDMQALRAIRGPTPLRGGMGDKT